MKRTLTLIITAAMLSTLSGCGTKEHKPTGATLEVGFDHSYRSELLTVPSDVDPVGISSVGDYILLQFWSDPWQMYDPETDTLHDFSGYLTDVPDGKKRAIVGVNAMDGGYQVLYRTSPDEQTFEEWKISDLSYDMEYYDTNLNLIRMENITDRFNPAPYITSWETDDAGYNYIESLGKDNVASLHCCDPDFKLLGGFIGDTFGTGDVFTDAQGNVYTGQLQMNYFALQLDPETMTAKRIEVDGMPEFRTNVFEGFGEYNFCCSDDDGIYGVNVTENKTDFLLSWTNSDFRPQTEVIALEDGSFLLLEYTGDNESDLYRLTARTPEEMEQMECISLASFWADSGMVADLAYHYNRQSDSHRIVVYDYQTEYPDLDYLGLQDQFNEDLLHGIVPDIIDSSSMSMEYLANKGILEDMNPYFENDAEFQAEDYFMNFLEASEYKGRLTSVGLNYYVSAAAAKTEHLNGITGLTPETMTQLYDAMPEGMRLTTKRSADDWFYHNSTKMIGYFVDMEKGTCNFENAEFIQFLELCGREHSTGGQLEVYPAFREDAALLHFCDLTTLQSYHILTEGVFGNEAFTLLNVPFCKGGAIYARSVLSVNHESFYKEQIWDFIKFCLSEEQQMFLNQQDSTLPVNRNAAMAIMQEEINETDPEKLTWYITDEQIPLSAPTQAEMDAYLAFLEGICSCSNFQRDIILIMCEESDMYFAGDCTAEQAAKNIQSRVSLYLAEQQ
ncbi:MAG: hypothetical protein IJ265_03330 [Oscillospiraceae bacterium]|nr:hypothetical protein [Oscillospiraceae bacterium]